MIDFSSITPEQWRTFHDAVIAARLRCSPATVAKRREELGHPKVRKPGSGPKRKFTLQDFDLYATNSENAERLGITPQRAGQVRKQLAQSEGWL